MHAICIVQAAVLTGCKTMGRWVGKYYISINDTLSPLPSITPPRRRLFQSVYNAYVDAPLPPSNPCPQRL